MGNVTAQPDVDVFRDALPVGLRHAPEDRAQHQFFIAAELILHVRLKLPDIVDLARNF